jgi:hypothetical protein
VAVTVSSKNRLLRNNAINSGSEKRRAFVAPIFTAGYGERWIQSRQTR